MSDTQHFSPPSSQARQELYCLSISKLVSLEPIDSPQSTTQKTMLLIRFHSADAPPLVKHGSAQLVADTPISISCGEWHLVCSVAVLQPLPPPILLNWAQQRAVCPSPGCLAVTVPFPLSTPHSSPPPHPLTCNYCFCLPFKLQTCTGGGG